MTSSPVTLSFGDRPSQADALLAPVIAGTQSATCGALRDFGPGKEAMPVVGGRDVVLDGQGRHAAVIETLQVTMIHFDEVDAVFAYDKGEGDRTLADWRKGHQTFFERNGGYSPDMKLVFERFKLVEVLDQGKQVAS